MKIMKIILNTKLKIITLMIGSLTYHFYIENINLNFLPFYVLLEFYILIVFLDIIIFYKISKKILKPLVWWFISLILMLFLEPYLYTYEHIHKYEKYDITNVVYRTFNENKKQKNIEVSLECQEIINKNNFTEIATYRGIAFHSEHFNINNTNHEKLEIFLTLARENDDVIYDFYCYFP